jgi:hypothetical protein
VEAPGGEGEEDRGEHAELGEDTGDAGDVGDVAHRGKGGRRLAPPLQPRTARLDLRRGEVAHPGRQVAALAGVARPALGLQAAQLELQLGQRFAIQGRMPDGSSRSASRSKTFRIRPP